VCGYRHWEKAPSTKRITDLFEEILHSEATLRRVDGTVFRCLRVAKLVVRQPGRVHHHLVCTEQRSACTAAPCAAPALPILAASLPALPAVPATPAVPCETLVTHPHPPLLCHASTAPIGGVARAVASGKMRKRAALLPSEKLMAGEDIFAGAIRCIHEELCVSDPARIDLVKPSHVEWVEVVDSPSFPSLTTQYRLHQVDVFIKGLPQTAFETEEAGGKAHRWQWHADTSEKPRRERESKEGRA
jgi:hypothetical protein